MHFILGPNGVNALDQLREAYETGKPANLKGTPSSRFFVYFGAPDIEQRNEQILFLGKVKAILEANLPKPEEIGKIQYTEYNLNAYRTMIAACLYVLWQLKGSKQRSVLYTIIEKMLGITAANFLDTEDKQACYRAAQNVMHAPKAFEDANADLVSKGLEPFTSEEWKAFTGFLNNHCYESPTIRTPVSSITKPFFGRVFQRGGTAVGLALTNTLERSVPSIVPTTLIGSTWLILGPATPAGFALLAPVIAAQIFRYFVVLSIVDASRIASDYVGQGVGATVGLPIDLTYSALCGIFNATGRYYESTYGLDKRDGIRISDGATIIAGMAVKEIEGDKVPEGHSGHVLVISNENEITIDGERIVLDASIPFPSAAAVKQDPDSALETAMQSF